MKRFFNDIKKYFPYAVYSAKAELKAEISSSYLNWIWWILEPVCFMFIYYFISTIVFRGNMDFPLLFIFIGLSAWNFFNKVVLTSVKLVQKNSPIVSKIYLPKFILIIEKMMVNGFKMMISFCLVLVMMPFFGVKFDINILFMIPYLVLLFLFTFGVCTWLLHFGVFVEDLFYIVNIGLKLLFYMTGIFYDINDKLSGKYPALSDFLLTGNPVAFIIDELRNVMLYNGMPDHNTSPHWVYMLGWYAISCFILYIGIKMIYKYENSYVKVI